MVLKKLFFKGVRLVELLINLTIFVYGPYVAYRTIDVGEYVRGTLLFVVISLIAVVVYYDSRLKKTILGKIFHLIIFWEGVKHKVKRRCP